MGYKHAENTEFLQKTQRPSKQTRGAIIKKAEHTFADTPIDLAPIPFEEATDFLKATVSMTKAEWLELEPKLRFRAFTMARLGEADHIEAVKKHLTKALDTGEAFAETWQEVKEKLATGGEQILPGYFETVYRTNVQSAYSAGKLLQYKNNMPPAWELLVLQDERTSDTCTGIVSTIGNGKALASTHSFWQTHGFPPYHFNCRTSFRAVYDYEIKNGDTKLVQPATLHFKAQKGFNGNTVSTGSWWKLTDSMMRRAKKYGLKKEFDEVQKELFNSEKAKEILDKQKPVNPKVLEKEKKKLEKRGYEVIQNNDIDKYLEFTGREAVVVAPKFIYLHSKISASGLYEEIIHTYQYEKMGKPNPLSISKKIIYQNEIEAKKKLLKNIKKYGITKYEVNVIKDSIKNYELLLKNILDKEG